MIDRKPFENERALADRADVPDFRDEFQITTTVSQAFIEGMDHIEDVLLLLSSCPFSPIIEINQLQIEADTAQFDQNILAVRVQVVFPKQVDLLQSAGEAIQPVLSKVRLQSLARVTRDPPLQGFSPAKIRATTRSLRTVTTSE